MNEHYSNKGVDSTARPYLVRNTGNTGRANSIVGVNQHVKKSVYRLVFESQLEITSLRQVARLTGLTGPRSEAKVLDAIRETVREAIKPTPPSPGAAMWGRRAA